MMSENKELKREIAELRKELEEAYHDLKWAEEDAEDSIQRFFDLQANQVQLRWYEKVLRYVFT